MSSEFSSANRRIIAVITGGNKGIGYCIVKALCHKLKAGEQHGGTVYLTARSEEKGKAAVTQLNKGKTVQEVILYEGKVGYYRLSAAAKFILKNGFSRVQRIEAFVAEGVHPAFHLLDIESSESVTEFARYLKIAHGAALDILVNNAGIAYFTNPEAPIEVQAKHTLDVNYFGTLRVCKELFPLLRTNARVVNVSSQLGHLSKINGEEPSATLLRGKFCSPSLTEQELNELVNSYISLTTTGSHRQNGWPNSSYAVSKVAITALTRIQQRELDKTRPGDDILVNAVHPGWVKSDMTGGKGKYSTEEGSEAPVYAALLPTSPNSPRGQYIWRDKSVVDWIDKTSILKLT